MNKPPDNARMHKLAYLEIQLRDAGIAIQAWTETGKSEYFDWLERSIGVANCIVTELRNQLRGVEPPKVGP